MERRDNSDRAAKEERETLVAGPSQCQCQCQHRSQQEEVVNRGREDER